MATAADGSATSRIALLAGSGSFPFLVAEEAKRQGRFVVAFGMQGWADPNLASVVDAYEGIEVGALGTLISRLKAHGVREAIMAGKVTKEVLFTRSTSFDAELLAMLQTVNDTSVNALLGAIAARLAREGITLMDSSTFLKSSLCPAGVLTSRAPTAVEQDDIHYGVQVAQTLASLDVGQTILVKRHVVVAVEALEGTDAAIRRAHEVAGTGLVMIKVASAAQDMRFDLPVLGEQTIATLSQCGVSCAAVAAHKTLLLNKARLIERANAAHLCLVGVDMDGSRPAAS
jgi:DUF1009 family protein